MNAKTAKLLRRYAQRLSGNDKSIGYDRRGCKRLWNSIARPARGAFRARLQQRLA